MTDNAAAGGLPELPQGGKAGGAARFVLNTAAGAIPFVGGILAAGAGAWSEREQ